MLRDEKAGNPGSPYRASRLGAMEAWAHIARALGASDRPEDRELSSQIARFVRETPTVREWVNARQREGRSPADVSTHRQERDRGPEIGR